MPAHMDGNCGAILVNQVVKWQACPHGRKLWKENRLAQWQSVVTSDD